MINKSLYITPRSVPYCPLLLASAFNALTPEQRLYAHHMMHAGWSGASVVAKQVSHESYDIIRMCQRLFAHHDVSSLKQAASNAGCTSQAIDDVLSYFARVYANMGNYLSFGDSKFIPACTVEEFTSVLRAVNALTPDLSDALLKVIYDLDESKLALNFPPKGSSSYYSENITREDVNIANDYLASKKMDPINTRVWKVTQAGKSHKDSSNTTKEHDDDDKEEELLVIRVASVEVRQEPVEEYKGKHIRLEYGDYHTEMERVVHHLTEAKKYVSNDTQAKMLDHYIAHFTSGNVDEHKASQKEWVRDRGPVVESNIGFIESYRDPSGVRAEWEGFVAVVNKLESAQYTKLVSHATDFIRLLPWGTEFEKDTFTSPDFTSLDVLGFAGSGIPAGICIPNYDEIRQEFGFKNVYLANVVSAVNFKEKLTHLNSHDWELYKENIIAATSINVGIHELLGHGTGKLLMQREDGTFNFDAQTLRDPFTQELIASSSSSHYYKPGETFSAVFGHLGNSYEECRAEAVSMYLCVHPELLAIFDITEPKTQEHVIYTLWLNMVRNGLVGLQFYTPEMQKWQQAHMQARYCILQTLLQCENSIVKIMLDESEGLIITIDADRIKTDGVKAIGELLCHLNINKSMANAKRGTAYYEKMTSVHEQELKYREIVLAKRKPRKEYVQPHTTLNADGSDVQLHEYDGSVEGMLTSFIARHKDIPL